MGKRTKKQKLAQQANEKAARKRISSTQKQVTVISIATQASGSTNLASQALEPPQNGSKTNLMLKDSQSGDTLPMRISPTSLYKQNLANKSAAKGKALLQKLKNSIPDQEARGLFELGVYHSVGESYLGFTKESKSGKTKDEASELLKWARDHSKQYLLSIKTLLPADWKQDMEAREKKDFLRKYFGRQAKLLSPWWTTVTFFDSFTAAAHIDKLDHPPSFLFNFGAPCNLVLPNYNTKVQLDHLDIAIFNAHKLEHSTEIVGDPDQVRWAFSAFYRQAIFLEKGHSQAGSNVLDRVLGEEEGETQVRGANK